MRAWADERHVAGEHVEELRNLVDVPAPQPAADPGQRADRCACACWITGAVVERAHGAELDDAERLLIEAVAPLHEEDRPRAVELDEDGDQDQERRQRTMRAPAARRDRRAASAMISRRGQRQAGQLQARERCRAWIAWRPRICAEPARARDGFRPAAKEGLGAAIDGLGSRPGHQQEDGVRLEAGGRRRQPRQDRDREWPTVPAPARWPPSA